MAGFVEVLQRFFPTRFGISRVIFLRPLTSYRAARYFQNSLDVDRGEDIGRDNPLGEKDRVLEVIALAMA